MLCTLEYCLESFFFRIPWSWIHFERKKLLCEWIFSILEIFLGNNFNMIDKIIFDIYITTWCVIFCSIDELYIKRYSSKQKVVHFYKDAVIHRYAHRITNTAFTCNYNQSTKQCLHSNYIACVIQYHINNPFATLVQIYIYIWCRWKGQNFRINMLVSVCCSIRY